MVRLSVLELHLNTSNGEKKEQMGGGLLHYDFWLMKPLNPNFSSTFVWKKEKQPKGMGKPGKFASAWFYSLMIYLFGYISFWHESHVTVLGAYYTLFMLRLFKVNTPGLWGSYYSVPLVSKLLSQTHTIISCFLYSCLIR